MAYKLYRKAKIREVPLQKQIQWILFYVQEETADV